MFLTYLRSVLDILVWLTFDNLLHCFSRPGVRCALPMTPAALLSYVGAAQDSGDQATTAGNLSRSLYRQNLNYFKRDSQHPPSPLSSLTQCTYYHAQGFTDTWSEIPQMYPVHGAATTFYRGKFWVLGGSTGQMEKYCQIYISDDKVMTAMTTPSLTRSRPTTPRRRHGVLRWLWFSFISIH